MKRILYIVLAVVLVLSLCTGCNNDSRTDDDFDDEPITIKIGGDPGADEPGDNDAPFVEGEAGFSTNDPVIKMIEVNQCLSYGFDTDTGEFYVMDNFVAGKETAFFIDLDEPLDTAAEVQLTVERDNEQVAVLTSYELVDDSTLLFHPQSIGEVGNWEQGAYTFTFKMGGSTAKRTTIFHKSIQMKVLAVPLICNYGGEVIECGDRWKEGGTMLTALYPIAKDDIYYELGDVQDFSDIKYDLETDAGSSMVLRMLDLLQTPDNYYTMISGFMPEPIYTKVNGVDFRVSGLSSTKTNNIICESLPHMMQGVVHEIAHCYGVGDEYEGGLLNNLVNAPPYGMKGSDYNVGWSTPAVGEKEHVKGGPSVGIKGTGSVIYEQQRAYWHEGRELLGTLASFMSSGTDEYDILVWISSEIWNHLFYIYTGQDSEDDASYRATSGSDNDNIILYRGDNEMILKDLSLDAP